MALTPEEEAIDIEHALNRIEDVIVSGELPNNLSGDLMSQSLTEFYRKLSQRFAELQAKADQMQ